MRNYHFTILKRGINIALLLLMVTISNAQEWNLLSKTLPDPGQSPNYWNYFGRGLALDGNYMVVGAPYANGINNEEEGAAEVFYFDGTSWVFQATLKASDGMTYDGFGQSLAIEDDVIIIGAPYTNAVYVFERPEEGWSSTVETTKLTASDVVSGDYFGYSVALSGDVTVVGAYRKDGEEGDSGAAYVFEKSGESWTDANEVAKLTSSDETSSGYFGYSVSISESTVLIGAYRESSGSGVVYIFEKTETWEETFKLTASNASSSDYFGYSVSISGDIVVIGASEEDDIATNSGAAYVFEKIDNSWEEVIKLKANDAEPYDYFGKGVAVHGNTIAVGAEGKEAEGGHGAAYIFEKEDDEWGEPARIMSSDNEGNAYFGRIVAISGGMMVTGADYDDDLARDAGAVYAFQEPAEGWSNVDVEDEFKLTSNQEGSEFNADYYQYGEVVDMDGDYAVVGSPGELGHKGAAYVYQYAFGEWKRVAKLTVSDAEEDDSFGYSVAIHENTIAIGAPWDNDYGSASGAVYVFEKPMDGWIDMTETVKLSASDQASSDYFGRNVDIEKDIIVAGANGANGLSGNEGAAYVFIKPESGWQPTVETAKLYATDTESGDDFGTSVAVEGDIIVINAENENTYVFEKPADGWVNMTETAKLTTSTGTSTNGSIAIDEEVIVVGASSVYLYEKPEEGWIDMTETAQLSTENSGTGFGYDVAISEDRVVVGAYSEDTEELVNVGSAYFFEKPVAGWSDMIDNTRLIPTEGEDEGNFGRSVAISENMLLVGASGYSSAGVYAGTAYFYTNKSFQHISFDLSDKVYGDTPFVLTATSNTSNNIQYQSSNSSVISIAEDGETATINSSGTVTIIASQEEDIDYFAGSAEQMISVNKAPLTITADNKEMLQGDAVPVLTMSIDGFVYDDSEASIEIPTISTSATGEEAGSFEIVLTGGSADSYELILVNGLLTVTETGDDNGDDDDSDDNGDDDSDDDSDDNSDGDGENDDDSDDNDGDDGDGSDDNNDDDNNDDILSTQTPNESYTIYPNPTASQLTINTDNPIKTIEIVDLNGKVLVHEERSNTVDVSGLEAGMYILMLEEISGTFNSIRFIKK